MLHKPPKSTLLLFDRRRGKVVTVGDFLLLVGLLLGLFLDRGTVLFLGLLVLGNVSGSFGRRLLFQGNGSCVIANG